MFLVLGCLLLAGVMTRVQVLDRSLWLDEAWVANSIRAASLHEAIHYNDWLQTTPPLFIALSRIVTAVFGTSNIGFRLLPVFFGIVSILLFFFLAVKLLRPSFAMIAALLFVSSPPLILYSQSLKQYSTDVFSAIALLVLGWLYLERRTGFWFYFLLAGFVVLSFLSYPAMLFLPFLLYAAFVKVDLHTKTKAAGEIRHKWPRFALMVGLGVLVCVGNYLFYIAPNNTAALAEFFEEGFHDGGSVVELFQFYGARLSSLTGSFFFGGQRGFRLVTTLITAVGFIYLWTSQTSMSHLETFQTPILWTAPIAGIVALNIAGMFPLPGFHHRLLLFVFPITALVFCIGLQSLASVFARLIASRLKSFQATSAETALGSVTFTALAVPVFLFVTTVGVEPFFAGDHEDSEAAIDYLAQRVQMDDVLYIHATMREQFKLYGQTLPAGIGSVVYGKIGAPCCPRRDYRNPRLEASEDISGGVGGLSKAAAGRYLWLLSTDRELHRLQVQRNDVEIFDRGLASQGCRKIDEVRFVGVYIGRFDCKSK